LSAYISGEAKLQKDGYNLAITERGEDGGIYDALVVSLASPLLSIGIMAAAKIKVVLEQQLLLLLLLPR
jgi:hypothetical protein